MGTLLTEFTSTRLMTNSKDLLPTPDLKRSPPGKSFVGKWRHSQVGERLDIVNVLGMRVAYESGH